MIRWLFVGCALLSLAPAPLRAEDQGDLERRVKAAFLYKFAGYVEWPPACFPDAATPVRIAVLGDERLRTDLASMVVGHTVNGRPVTVTAYSEDDSLEGVHVLFVGRSEAARLAKLSDEARKRSVLLVSDVDGALDQGSVIGFVLNRRRVRFDISLAAASRSGLTLSSRLLSVARSVVMVGS
jgi:uncharacterized protein DUF4154